MRFDQQSIQDLEFNEICDRLGNYCLSKKAKQNASQISAFSTIEDVKEEFAILKEMQEVHASEDLSMPHPATDSIDGALKLLHISNGVLTLDELLKVYTLCLGTKRLIEFSKKNRVSFPLIYEACEHISEVDSVLTLILSVLNEKNEIRDDATTNLLSIRKQLISNHREINKNFEKALRYYRKEDVLADNLETFLDEKRLLAVQATYKKTIPGKIIGESAKGNVAYVEIEANLRLNQHQGQLRLEERSEIFKILAELTDKLRHRKKDLEAFQRLLVRFDLLNAKVLLAKSYVGIIPKINTALKFEWFNAKHPLLFTANANLEKNTIGQDISLSEAQRFLVISGPNAGGKSITLKTVGLIQMMFQCGLFVPLDLNSSCTWFDQILSDIGDNQSIQNQLSTYSYRLNRMTYFLRHVNANSLLLLDEFGSGSDPELGGALAEVFYEELYAKKTFAVITTHYANIKILTASLHEAANACMLFDSEKLTPLYKLSIGQPGSSFTFEVAHLNGISNGLIDRAKAKVSETKLNIDQLTAALQREKAELEKLNEAKIKSTSEARNSYEKYNRKLEVLTDKAAKQAAFFEQQNKYVNAGKKLFDYIKKFEKHKTNKELNEAVKRYVAIEKEKILGLKAAQREAEKKRKAKSTEKVNQALLMDKELRAPELPKLGNSRTETIPLEIQKPARSFKIGDAVIIKSTKQKARIKAINGQKVTLEVGNFVVNTKINELEN